MIVDTSAVVAIAKREGTAAQLRDALLRRAPSLMSAVAFVELSIVLRAQWTGPEIDRLLEALDVTPVPVTVDQARLAARSGRRRTKLRVSHARGNEVVPSRWQATLLSRVLHRCGCRCVGRR